MRLAEQFQREWRNVSKALLLVTALAIVVVGFVREFDLGDGTIMFVIPVLVAATRWGVSATVAAAVGGLLACAFFFYPPLYSFAVKGMQSTIDLSMLVVVSVVASWLAFRLKRQTDQALQRESDIRDLYAFSRRLASAFGVSDIHAAIEDHLATAMHRRVVLFAGREPDSDRHDRESVPARVRSAVADVMSGRREPEHSVSVADETGAVWLVRAVSPKTFEFGVIAVDVGRDANSNLDEMRSRVDVLLADATATLERLDVAHAISEARMRSQTEQLREALIGSVSHELRTPLASILGAATVLGAASALDGEHKLKALVHDVRDEAERLNDDIQNLLDASRISSDGLKPQNEWADPADIVNSALERCRKRLGARRVSVDLPRDVPLVHVDPVLVQQALVQVFDNAAKYSPPQSAIDVRARVKDSALVLSVADEGSGLTPAEKSRMWDRFFRGSRQATVTKGSGLGLWIASAFVAANGGRIEAVSAGAGSGTTLTIELPIAAAAEPAFEGEADE